VFARAAAQARTAGLPIRIAVAAVRPLSPDVNTLLAPLAMILSLRHFLRFNPATLAGSETPDRYLVRREPVTI